MSVSTEPETTTTAPPASATITAANLLILLKAALLFAEPYDDEPSMPQFQTVRLEAAGGTITATASNRYIAGHARKQATGALRPVVLGRGSAEAVAAAFDHLTSGGQYDRNALIHITVKQSHLRPDVVTFAGPTTTIAVETENVTFPYPTLEKMFASMPDRETTAMTVPIALDMRWLDAVSAVTKLDHCHDHADRNRPARIYAASPKMPVRFEVGDWFVAAVMPTAIRVGWDNVAAADMPNVPFGLSVAEVSG